MAVFSTRIRALLRVRFQNNPTMKFQNLKPAAPEKVDIPRQNTVSGKFLVIEKPLKRWKNRPRKLKNLLKNGENENRRFWNPLPALSLFAV